MGEKNNDWASMTSPYTNSDTESDLLNVINQMLVQNPDLAYQTATVSPTDDGSGITIIPDPPEVTIENNANNYIRYFASPINISPTPNTSPDSLDTWVRLHINDWANEWISRKIKVKKVPVQFSYDGSNDNIILDDLRGSRMAGDLGQIIQPIQGVITSDYDQNAELILSLLSDALLELYVKMYDIDENMEATDKQLHFATQIARSLGLLQELSETPRTKKEYSKFISAHVDEYNKRTGHKTVQKKRL